MDANRSRWSRTLTSDVGLGYRTGRRKPAPAYADLRLQGGPALLAEPLRDAVPADKCHRRFAADPAGAIPWFQATSLSP